jgi:hypothetical protein
MIALNANLDMSDVLAVVTSRAETTFNENLTDAKRAVAALEKQLSDATAASEKQYASEAEAAATVEVAMLKDTIERLGGVVKVLCLALPTSAGVPEDSVGAIVAIEKPRSGSLNFPVVAKKSETLRSMEAEVEILQEQVAAAKAAAVEWKRKIANIPQLERHYRGKLAEARLAENANGQRVLSLLTEDLEHRMRLLSSN